MMREILFRGMANEKRLIDVDEAYEIARSSGLHDDFGRSMADLTSLKELLEDCPTVYAVEIPDAKLFRAVKMLLRQYEHSKNSEYVHSPVAHAFFHTWKQLDKRSE